MGSGRRWAAVVVWALVCGAAAQDRRPGIDGPPACPKGTPNVGSHPSAAAARQTAEKESADASVVVSAEPMENFGVARYRVEDYGECVGTEGCYWKDLDAQLRRAEGALRAEIGKHGKGERLAMVLDIDETTLSSYCEMKREDFGYLGKQYNDWIVTTDAALGIPGTLQLFKTARAAGVAVFFVTGRPESQRAATERNLRAAGFDGWAGVVLRSQAESLMPTVEYKSSERRKKVTEQGYKLLLSVGDQWSDLMGEPKAEVSVKLPNPFYYLP